MHSASWRRIDKEDKDISPTARFFKSQRAEPCIRIILNEEKNTSASDDMDLMLYFQHKNQPEPYAPQIKNSVARVNKTFYLNESIKKEFVKCLLGLDVLKFNRQQQHYEGSIYLNRNASFADRFNKLFDNELLVLPTFKLQRVGYFLKDKMEATFGNIELVYRCEAASEDKDVGSKEIMLNMHLCKDRKNQALSIDSLTKIFIKDANTHIHEMDARFAEKLLDINPYDVWPESISNSYDKTYYPAINPHKTTLKSFLFFARGIIDQQEEEAEKLNIGWPDKNAHLELLKEQLNKIILSMPRLARDHGDPRLSGQHLELRQSIDAIINNFNELILERREIIDLTSRFLQEEPAVAPALTI